MNTLTDTELINLARENDEDAKQELFNRCKNVINYNVIRYKGLYFGKLNHFDVEDLISECHIAVMEAIKLFNPDRGSGFANFSKFIIRTRLLDFLERKSKESRNMVDNTVLDKIQAPVDIFRDLTIKVKNERDREVINLFLLGMRQGDIASEFKISKQRVHQIIRECIK